MAQYHPDDAFELVFFCDERIPEATVIVFESIPVRSKRVTRPRQAED
jgi:hypothetical protein